MNTKDLRRIIGGGLVGIAIGVFIVVVFLKGIIKWNAGAIMAIIMAVFMIGFLIFVYLMGKRLRFSKPLPISLLKKS